MTNNDDDDHNDEGDDPTQDKNKNNSIVYRFTPALHAIAATTTKTTTRTTQQHEENDNTTTTTSTATTGTTMRNLFRDRVRHILSGQEGDWFLVPVASLMEFALQALDRSTLALLQLLPSSLPNNNDDDDDSNNQDPTTVVTQEFDSAIATFWRQNHTRKSDVTTMAVECVSSLSLQFISKTIQQQQYQQQQQYRTRTIISPSFQTLTALRQARFAFFQKTLFVDDAVAVNNNSGIPDDILIDHMEAAATSLYKSITKPATRSGGGGNHAKTTPPPRLTRVYAYQLSLRGCSSHGTKAECLIRKLWSHYPISNNNGHHAQTIRWNAQMALHLRAVLRVLDRFLEQVSQELHSQPQLLPKLELLDQADGDDELLEHLLQRRRRCSSSGGKQEMMLDLRTTPVYPFTQGEVPTMTTPGGGGGGGTGVMMGNTPASVLQGSQAVLGLGQNGAVGGATTTVSSTGCSSSSSSNKVLVIEKMDLLVVKIMTTRAQQRTPRNNSKMETRQPFLASPSSSSSLRGTVLCCIPLLHVIAAGVDHHWLHIAVRHENYRSLIQNGNLAVCFDSVETSRRVKQELDETRQARRQELAHLIRTKFLPEVKASSSPSVSRRLEIPAQEEKKQNVLDQTDSDDKQIVVDIQEQQQVAVNHTSCVDES